MCEQKEVFLLKLGELVLKGLNRSRFEEKLVREVVRRVKPFGVFHVESRQSVVTVTPEGETDMDAAFEACARVFGVMTLTRARAVAKDITEIVSAAVEYLYPTLHNARSFKVESRRSDKGFPLTSPEISREVGGALHDAYPNLTVDVHQPEVRVVVEIRDRAAYVHAGPRPGAGGLPSGTAGKAVLLLSGGIDSPVAGYMMAKRGLDIIPVHFYSYPYTSPEALEKVKTLARLLGEWTGPSTLRIVPFTAIQEAIRKQCPEAYATLIMRRFMMDIAGRLAQRLKAPALITGESLGQVASQTMEALTVTEQMSSCPVLRPLIGMDKEEIVTIARKIGTFETSILPYEDCCTVFTPKHPRTKPRLESVLEAESELDREGLIEASIAGIERVKIG